jgi:hypothetical protein
MVAVVTSSSAAAAAAAVVAALEIRGSGGADSGAAGACEQRLEVLEVV